MPDRFGSALNAFWPPATLVPSEGDEACAKRAGSMQPREQRSDIVRVAGLYVADLKRQAFVRNLSRSGLMLETSLAPPVGEAVTVKMDGLAPVSGQVRWRRGGIAGIEFDQPLSVGEMFRGAAGQQDIT